MNNEKINDLFKKALNGEEFKEDFESMIKEEIKKDLDARSIKK